MSSLVVLENGKSPGSGCRDCPTMNDLIVAEKIAPWQKLKALVRQCSERPIDGDWNSVRGSDGVSIGEQARRTPIHLLDNCW